MNSPPWYPGANAGVSFGTTAPLNPVRGHFWWNGAVLAMFDGAVWVSTVNGQIVSPSPGPGPTPTPTPVAPVIISTTAPGNPVSGMQWWDGSVLRVFDGAQWNIVGPGGAAGPVPTTTRAFSMTNPANLTTGPVNTWNIVPFTQSPSVDTFVGWNATTHQYMPTRAGSYLFFARAYLGGGSAILVGLTKNDGGTGTIGNSTQFIVINENASAVGPVGGWIGGGGISVMNGTTDFVRFWVYSGDAILYGTNFPVLEAYLLP